jgi:hypothetical protein
MKVKKNASGSQGLFESALSSWLLALRRGSSAEQGVVSRNYAAHEMALRACCAPPRSGAWTPQKFLFQGQSSYYASQRYFPLVPFGFFLTFLLSYFLTFFVSFVPSW